MFRFRSLIGVSALLVLTSGVAAADMSTERASQVTLTAGQFQSSDHATTAFTYDTTLVPPGSSVAVFGTPLGKTATMVALTVNGLVPNRTYGAHVHQKPCGTTPAAAGAHHQHEIDPNQPSVDPAYANPENEIWLDFTTNNAGQANAQTIVPWQFEERRGGSVVFHAQKTATEPGTAGMAGARVGCVSVNF